MFETVDQAGLTDTFKPILRPPAWRMSPDCFIACEKMGIRALALSSKEYAKKIYAGQDIHFSNVVYYNLNPPFDPLIWKDENLEIVYHACEWDRNFLDIAANRELQKFLESNSSDVTFSFIEDLL
jgi:hypothetical protein